MSTSTVKLYKDTKIYPKKNFHVDSIANYLATFTPLTISDFQYIKHNLNLEIKVSQDQVWQEALSTYNYNYCSIKNSDSSRTVYYFITNKTWKSSSCIALTLVMDTINTFTLGTDYELDDKTLVNRQHKDRFVSYNISGYFSSFQDDEIEEGVEYSLNGQLETFSQAEVDASGTMYLYYRATGGTLINKYLISSIIFYSEYFVAYYGTNEVFSMNLDDLYSLNGTISFKVLSGLEYQGTPGANVSGYFVVSNALVYRNIDLASEGLTPVLYGTEKGLIYDDAQSWYLVYYGNSPIRLYVCADNPFSVTIDGDDTIEASDLTLNYYYYILPEDNFDDDQYNASISITTAEGDDVGAYRYLVDNSSLPFFKKVITVFSTSDGTTIDVYKLEYMDVGLGYFLIKTTKVLNTTSLTISTNLDSVKARYSSSQVTSASTMRQFTSVSFAISSSTVVNNGFSRLDRKDESLVKIIKLPYKPVNTFNGFKYDNALGFIYLDDLSTVFNYDITFSDYNPYEEIAVDLTSISSADLKDEYYESKLYHSDYYQPKFVYDSFTFVYALERLNGEDYIYSDTLNIRFSVTNTINSKMMFTMVDYNCDGKLLEDYSNIVIVARNNEVPILNSAYESYLKNGYNYDVKNKDRQIASSWVAAGVGAVGTIGALATGNVVGVAAGISLAASTLSQLMGAVNTTAQAEQTIHKRIQDLKLQKESVYGSDDVDLMTRYTGNKAKLMLYQVSDRMKSVLYDLFFYTGYVDGTMHTPDTTSRSRFNFVSCDPVINNNANIPEDIIDDLVLRYNAGVTFIHYYLSTWDFDQEYENWEIDLISQEVHHE